ncbi:hypothetical protein Mesil_1345 [Allomeiothermus silvanus DSM 9946]|uniref:Uncharacterized protein n=1 Tax=Allomeiothermus silvanus (strain ATCC 700542 / DSM 9946 / NBRC 106475 / NCIMB 13440 / VI-R2) TaxID=526227 RepID=D7BEJ5_ALLS1|nr:hypothetical protein [Allomeiothermus silvanus]ADH63238.1 hypothetical protein Mesil_1345 [Allomeiothermus silvanus DSM 9946]
MREIILLELREIRRLIDGAMLQCGRCPRCGRPLPALERYTLERDEEPAVYCPCCGSEWGVQDA